MAGCPLLLFDQLKTARIYDLAQPYFIGMPHYPAHPPFLFSLTKKHGDLVLDGEVSSAADAITFGGHVGTHIDALCHFSCGGLLHGGLDVSQQQSYAEGIRRLSVDTIAPILRRGVLLDVAAHLDLDALPVDFEITANHLESIAESQKVQIRPQDVVLLRTGWARFFDDPRRFITGGKAPNPLALVLDSMPRAGSATAESPRPAPTPWLSKRFLPPCRCMCTYWSNAAFTSSRC